MAENKTTGGFVLIEVLVAVAVAGLILIALLKSFVGTWYGIGVVREEAEAMMIARSLISAAAPRANASEVNQQGNVGRYSWTLVVKKAPIAQTQATDKENENPFTWSLYRIGVIVIAPNGRRTTVETSRLSRP